MESQAWTVTLRERASSPALGVSPLRLFRPPSKAGDTPKHPGHLPTQKAGAIGAIQREGAAGDGFS